MRSSKGRPGRLATALAVYALGVVAGACSGSDAERQARLIELEQQRHSLLLQFMAAQAPIRRTQAAALEAENVRATQEEFYSVLRRRVVEIDPSAEALLDRAVEVGQELDQISGPVLLAPGEKAPTGEEKAAVAKEFGELEKALRPLNDQAMRDPLVAAAFAALQDSLTAEMIRRDSTVEVQLAMMREIESRMIELDRKIAELKR
jgi:hypothetical protein